MWFYIRLSALARLHINNIIVMDSSLECFLALILSGEDDFSIKFSFCLCLESQIHSEKDTKL